MPHTTAPTISVPAAAATLRTSTRTVRRLIANGSLAATRLPPRGRWRIRRADVVALSARLALVTA